MILSTICGILERPTSLSVLLTTIKEIIQENTIDIQIELRNAKNQPKFFAPIQLFTHGQ